MPYDNKKALMEAAARRTKGGRIFPGEKGDALKKFSKKKYKGKYAGPDKYKGVIPNHLKKKYKGKYFGKDSGRGENPNGFTDLRDKVNSHKKRRLIDDSPGGVKPIGKDFTTPGFRTPGSVMPYKKPVRTPGTPGGTSPINSREMAAAILKKKASQR